MPRSVIFGLIGVGLLLLWDRVAVASPPTAAQGIGVTTGVEVGGGLAPGGVHVSGGHLYQVTSLDWLVSTMDFTFGGSGSECFRDRDDELTCSHGPFDGVGIGATAAIRRYFAVRDTFEPFAQVGLGGRWVSFSDDSLRGIAAVAVGSGGIRALVHPSVHVVAAANLRVGLGFFGRNFGLEPQGNISVVAGVEFDLD